MKFKYELFINNKEKDEEDVFVMRSETTDKLKIEIDVHYEDSDTHIKDIDGNVVYEQKAKR